ncbi:MAG: hypothetical protein AABZ31_07895 [Bdellovibrionota bacterium]
MECTTGWSLPGEAQNLKKGYFMKTKKKVSIRDIERVAERGQDVNLHFTKGEIMPPPKEVQRVNVDFTVQMLRELDQHKLANKKRG